MFHCARDLSFEGMSRMFEKTLSLTHLPTTADKPAITHQQPDGQWVDLTYGQLAEAVELSRKRLARCGFRKGDRILFLGENHADWLPAFLAVTGNGIIAVPVDGSVPDSRLRAIVEHAEPVAIIAGPNQVQRCEGLLPEITRPVRLFARMLDEVAIPGNPLCHSVIDRDGTPQAPLPEETAAMFYTSGTTGEPKGIMLSHKAMAEAVRLGISIGSITAKDCMLTVLPFTHVFGLVDAGLVPLAIGARTVLLGSFHPMDIFQAIGRFRVAYLNIVPRLAEVLLAVISQTNPPIPPGLKVTIGGAACSPDVVRGLRQRGLTVIFGFGMTETCGGIIGNEGEPAESVGICLPGVEVKIDAPKDGVGEILFKAPCLLSGIYLDPEETKKVFDGEFLRTGDLGMVTPEGHLLIKGRLKDVIVCGGGMNVYPDELEGRLNLVTFAEESAVIGMKEGGHEFPMLVVKPRAAFFQKHPNLIPDAHIREQVRLQTATWAEWERFRTITLVETPLPRSYNQKVQRHILQKLVGALPEVPGALAGAPDKGTLQDTSSPGGEPSFDRVKSVLAGYLHRPLNELRPETRLADFPQLDSLGMMGLAAHLEGVLGLQLRGINLPPEPTLGHLTAELQRLAATQPASGAARAKGKLGQTTGLSLPPEMDFSWEAIETRLALLRKQSGAPLDAFGKPADASALQGNIEGFFGYSMVPLGLAGPLLVKGKHADGEFLLPLATTEGALVASVSRGCKLITAAGGARVRVLGDGVVRTPVFFFDSIVDLCAFQEWLETRFAELKQVAESTTRHGKLKSIEPVPMGTNLGLRCLYESGDASGQNICTIATAKMLEFIKNEYRGALRDAFLECNLSGDKKINGMNFTRNRGKKVVAEAWISPDLVREYLHAPVERVVKFGQTAMQGALHAHSFGSQAHFANVLTALFIAAGQDPACVAECAAGVTFLTERQGGLAASVTLPGIMVATIGGGTRLPTQQACLQILGCSGTGKAMKLAEITAAAVLAGELSLIGAMAADEFSNAHARYGRRG